LALLQGEKVSYPNALVVAVKSAWVETTGLDTTNCVTTTATVPTFDTSNPTACNARAMALFVDELLQGSRAVWPNIIPAAREFFDPVLNQ
jgi:hypothetical protein